VNNRNVAMLLVILSLVFSTPLVQLAPPHAGALTGMPSGAPGDPRFANHVPASDEGVPLDGSPYAVIDIPNSTLPSHGAAWSVLLNQSGLVSHLFHAKEISAQPSLVDGAPVIIIDASVGSDNGENVSDDFLNVLIQRDAPVVLLGRAAWLLHRVRGMPAPQLTSNATGMLLAEEGYSDAAFLHYPNNLTLPATLTLVGTPSVPRDPIQTEMSRLVNMTGSDDTDQIPVLRYDSYPLDTFLLALEDPDSLTDEGIAFLANVVAFATTLRESSTTDILSKHQESKGPLRGGLSYFHEPTIQSAFYSVRTVRAVVSPSEWSAWVSSHESLIMSLLNATAVAGASEIGFKDHPSASVADLDSTARALWLISTMSLQSYFNIDDIVAYLSSRQDTDGGFGGDITTTYHVLLALNATDRLASIDKVTVENWLRSCVIDGTETSDPDRWGGIAINPSAISPKNCYARAYVLSMQILGKSHNDPAKLTSWIQTRTSNGDGSYSDSLTPNSEVTVGTASALTTMSVLGTLSTENRTSGLSWLSSNQLESGGFGLGYSWDDTAAKTQDTAFVATLLRALNETSSSMVSGIVSYVSSIETPVGFEKMELLPSLMWSSWMLRISRLAHSAEWVSEEQARRYLAVLNGWNQYPTLENLTPLTAVEYGPYQYRQQSVWTQYFGVAASLATGYQIPENVKSSTVSYITTSQDPAGHFRPTPFMGAPTMQHTVAAVETLYQVGALGQVEHPDRLRQAILSEYRNGSWCSDSWDLQPFPALPTAVDWLSTRAALRTGVLNSTMVDQIASVIAARIQYKDLVALSYDVATLALLSANGYGTWLDLVNETAVLEALGPEPFSTGWFNSTDPWQPIFTATIVRMLSILGLRPRVWSGEGRTLACSALGSAALGGSIPIDVTVTSSVENHTVAILAFGVWTLYSDVLASDTLWLNVPSDAEVLGPHGVFVIVWDYGATRASARLTVNVSGQLAGVLSLDSTDVLIGNPVTGNVTWHLDTGSEAGVTNVTVRLGDPPFYREWYYTEESPLDLNIPTDDFSEDEYNLTVTLSRRYCEPLVLQRLVHLYTPVETYLDVSAPSHVDLGESVVVNWTLRVTSNGSIVTGKTVSLRIMDAANQTVYHATNDTGQFVWTPASRGNYTYILEFSGSKWYAPCEATGVVTVYEDTTVSVLCEANYTQYENVTLGALLIDQSGLPLPFQDVVFTVTSPSGKTVLQTAVLTNSSGQSLVSLNLTENGIYTFVVEYDGGLFLHASSNSTTFVSWIGSVLSVETTVSRAYVDEACHILVTLHDSHSVPLAQREVGLTIIYLPSTVVARYVLVTDPDGTANLSWTPQTAGEYALQAVFNRTASVGGSNDETRVEVWIPVTLTIQTGAHSQVGVANWIQVSATDHHGDPVSGIKLQVVVCGPSGESEVLHGVTTDGHCNWTWTPVSRGPNAILADGQPLGWYNASNAQLTTDVYETPLVSIQIADAPLAPSVVDVSIVVTGVNGSPIASCAVEARVWLGGDLVLNDTMQTDAEGSVHLNVSVNEPSFLTIAACLPAQEWLLESSSELNRTVYGTTTVKIILPGQPVVQGTTLGILVSLEDWAGEPMSGANLTLMILRQNGTIVVAEALLTSEDGTTVFPYEFTDVGDFTINATFACDGTNGRATSAVLQRVYATPNLVVDSPSISEAGKAYKISILLLDAVGDPISGRTVSVSIAQNGVLDFQAQTVTDTIPVVVSWYPSERGQAVITITHVGDVYYLSNSTTVSTTIFESVTGTVTVSDESIDYAENVTITYTLSIATTPESVVILFEVLNTELVPAWNITAKTNASGIAQVTYVAADATGILTIRVGPTENQFLMGGDVQTQVTVMSNPSVSVLFSPREPCVSETVNLTVNLVNELGIGVDGIQVSVTMHDPRGELVRLGVFSSSVSVRIVDGVGIMSLTLDTPGLYTIQVSFEGSQTVRSFSYVFQQILFSRTHIELTSATTDLVAGENISLTVELTDHEGAPLVGYTVALRLQGPQDLDVTLERVTNQTGHVSWEYVANYEGAWQLHVTFGGVGVHLAAARSLVVDVRNGVAIHIDTISSSEVVAGSTPFVIATLLTDTDGDVLEGFSLEFRLYHETAGLCVEGTAIQIGTAPVNITVVPPRMGHYVLTVSFAGTDHYAPGSTAVEFFATGTTSVRFWGPLTLDRAQNVSLQVRVLDEIGEPVLLSGINLTIELTSNGITSPLVGRLTSTNATLLVNLYGLPAGAYCLTVTVQDTDWRIGSAGAWTFNVTSEIHIIIEESQLSALVHDVHTLKFRVIDSLNESVKSGDVHLSVRDPSGKELLGGLLKNGQVVPLNGSSLILSWTPDRAGTYAFGIEFEDTAYLRATDYHGTITVRFKSEIVMTLTNTVTYGDDALVQVKLTDEHGVLREAAVRLSLLSEQGTQTDIDGVTGWSGTVSFRLSGLLAGTYIVTASFNGSSKNAGTSISDTLAVFPVLDVSIGQVGSPVVGSKVTAIVTVNVLGAYGGWTGLGSVVVSSPSGLVVVWVNFTAASTAEVEIEFIPAEVGEYSLNVTVVGLPAVATDSVAILVDVSEAPLSLTLDVSSTPVFLGTPLLGIVVLAIRRRVRAVSSLFPVEWHDGDFDHS